MQVNGLLKASLAGPVGIRAEAERFERGADPVTFTSTDAQRVLARAYGPSTRPTLKHHVEGMSFAAFVETAEACDVEAVRRSAKRSPGLISPRLAEFRDSAIHRAVLRRDAETRPLLKVAFACCRAASPRAWRGRPWSEQATPPACANVHETIVFLNISKQHLPSNTTSFQGEPRMKSYGRIALFSCLLVGCGSPTATPKTFHLKVERDPANDDNCQKTAITFHPPTKAEVIVGMDRDRNSIMLDSKDPNGDRDCVVRLIAKRQESQTDGKSKVEILIRSETPNGGSAGGPSIYTVDADESLNTMLDVTVAEGDFALDDPVNVGTLNGKPITLVVRRLQN